MLDLRFMRQLLYNSRYSIAEEILCILFEVWFSKGMRIKDLDLERIQYAFMQVLCMDMYGPVVQLVRTLACHARGRGFEPLPGRQNKRSDVGNDIRPHICPDSSVGRAVD